VVGFVGLLCWWVVFFGFARAAGPSPPYSALSSSSSHHVRGDLHAAHGVHERVERLELVGRGGDDVAGRLDLVRLEGRDLCCFGERGGGERRMSGGGRSIGVRRLYLSLCARAPAPRRDPRNGGAHIVVVSGRNDPRARATRAARAGEGARAEESNTRGEGVRLFSLRQPQKRTSTSMVPPDADAAAAKARCCCCAAACQPRISRVAAWRSDMMDGAGGGSSLGLSRARAVGLVSPAKLDAAVD